MRGAPTCGTSDSLQRVYTTAVPNDSNLIIVPGEQVSLAEEAFDDPSRLRETLQALGFDATTIDQRIAQYGASVNAELRAAPPSVAPFRGPSGKELIRSARRYLETIILQDVIYLEEPPQFTDSEVPLFLLTAPGPEKSAVTVSRSEDVTGTHDWTVTVFGSGLGAKQSLSIGQASTFVARGAAAKLVFVPVRIESRRVIRYKNAKLDQAVITSQALRPRDGQDYVNGVRDASPEEVAHYAQSAEKVNTYPIAHDSSNDVSTYETTFTAVGEYSASLGIKAFNVEGSTKVTIAFKHSVKLKFELPGGRDYDLLRPRALAGTLWR